MEGGHNKDTKASSCEASSPEPTCDDPGTMRSYYECTFCKRGFTTAQALGGHMNIHRKDRARTRHGRTASSVSGKAEEDSEGHGYSNPSSSHHRTLYAPVSESLKNYSLYLPASSSGGRDSRVAGVDDDMVLRRQRELSLFGQELQLGLGTHCDGSSTAVYEEAGKRKDVEDEDKLDLELRLGHQP